MRRFAQSDFDSIQRDEKGWKHVPCGDWTEVDFRGEHKIVIENDDEYHYSIFGNSARFGDCAIFGNRARFGDDARFGDVASLGDYASFGNHAGFGYKARFGDDARFSNCASFGDDTSFGDYARFGDYAIFGSRAIFGEDARFENEKVKNAVMFFVSNIGSRNGSAYAFCNTKTGEIFVRAGCWFSELDEFVERVKKVHAGTQHEMDYLAFVEFAKARFARYGKEQAE